MLELNVSQAQVTLTMFPYDCKSNTKVVMICPNFVCRTSMTKLPISFYHHQRCAMIFPHITVSDWEPIHLVLYRLLSLFRPKYPVRRRLLNWTKMEKGQKRKSKKKQTINSVCFFFVVSLFGVIALEQRAYYGAFIIGFCVHFMQHF